MRFFADCGGAATTILNCDASSDGYGGITSTISLVINVLGIMVAILGVIGITIVGIQYITARENEQQIRKAKMRLLQIVIGLALSVLVWSGVNFLVPGGLFNNWSGDVANVSPKGDGGDEGASSERRNDDAAIPEKKDDEMSTQGMSDNSVDEAKVTLAMGPNSQNVIKVKKGTVMTEPSAPVLGGQSFNGWHDAGGAKHDFSQPVNDDTVIYAQWYPTVSYAMKERGKWIFINNPEEIHADGMANNGHLIYQDTIPIGATEIYWEHAIVHDEDFAYALRFKNTGSNEVVMNVNRCGASDEGWDMEMTWRQYYDGSCSLRGAELRVPARATMTIFQGNGNFVVSMDYDDSGAYKFRSKNGGMDGVIDGVLNMSVSGGTLEMEALAYEGPYADTFDAIYNGNYTLSSTNPESIYTRVYSGHYDMLPVVKQESTFYINGGTPVGELDFGWKGRDGQSLKGKRLVTNTVGGTVETSSCGTNLIDDVFTTDIVNLRVPSDNGMMTIGVFDNYFDPRNIVVDLSQGWSMQYVCQLYGWPWNWGNWAVRYNDVITVRNDSTRARTLEFAADSSGSFGQTVGIESDGGFSIGTNERQVVWRVTLQPSEERVMESVIFIGGNSSGTLPKTLMVVD